MTNDGYTKEVFEALDFKDRHARVLEYLFENMETTGQDIQKNCNLQQPEVSLITTELEKMGILFKKITKEQGKGRPVQIILLKKGAHLALLKIVELREQRIATASENLAKIRSFLEQNPNDGAD
jgi:predicted transcriptional regulator